MGVGGAKMFGYRAEVERRALVAWKPGGIRRACTAIHRGEKDKLGRGEREANKSCID